MYKQAGQAGHDAGQAPIAPRRIAVVPAYNEEPTVKDVLERLYPLVDELLVVDDGSTDNTREVIEKWLPEHDARPDALVRGQPGHVGGLLPGVQRSAPAHRHAAKWAMTISCTRWTPTGSTSSSVLDELRDIAVAEGLDALLVQRDLSTYPLYKRLGNWADERVGVALGRAPAPRRRVRLPDLPRSARSPTPSTTTRATSTARPSRSLWCCAGSGTACATTSSSRCRCSGPARASSTPPSTLP